MGATTSNEGIVTVSSGQQQQAPEHSQTIDPIISSLQQLAKDVPQQAPGPKGPRDIALQEELKLSALVTEASEALSADVTDSMAEYQAWAAVRLRQAASRQLLVHLKIEEAVSKAEGANQHMSRLIHVASGINTQLNALSTLPQQVDGLCLLLRNLQQQCEQLQARVASSRRSTS